MQQIPSYTQETNMWWTVCNTVQQYMCCPDPHTCRVAPQLSHMSQQLTASTETKALGKLKEAASNSHQIIDSQLAD